MASLDDASDSAPSQMTHPSPGPHPPSSLSSVSCTSFQFVTTSPPSASDVDPPSPNGHDFHIETTIQGRGIGMSGPRKSSSESNDTTRWRYDPDPFSSNASASSSSPGRALPPTSPTPILPVGGGGAVNLKKRGSLLSYVPLSSFVSRRRKSLRDTTASNPSALNSRLTDVIEITASATGTTSLSALEDEEEAERERLRDEAALSIGLGSVLLEGSDIVSGSVSGNASFVDSSSFVIPEEEDTTSLSRASRDLQRPPERALSLESSYANRRGSTLSVATNSLRSPTGSGGPLTTTRRRAGSLAQSLFRSRTRDNDTASVTGATSGSLAVSSDAAPSSPIIPTDSPAIPAFPCSRGALRSVTRRAAEMSKYFATGPSGGMGFSRKSKGVWKVRYIVLSGPLKDTGRSYLHLFKSTGLTEKEIDRIEIDERGAWLYNDTSENAVSGLDAIGGRRDAIQVQGRDMGGNKEGSTPVGNDGRTVWILQINDAVERVRWKEAIESAVASRRSQLTRLAQPLTPTSVSFPDPLASLRSGISTAPGALLRTPLRPPPGLDSPRPLPPSTEKLGVGASPNPRSASSNNRVQGGVLRNLFRAPSPTAGKQYIVTTASTSMTGPALASNGSDKRRLLGKGRSNSIGGRVEMASLLSQVSPAPPSTALTSPAARHQALPPLDTSSLVNGRTPIERAGSPLRAIVKRPSVENTSSTLDERPLSPGSLMPAPRPVRRHLTATVLSAASQEHFAKPSERSDQSVGFRGPSGAFGAGYESDGPMDSLVPPRFSPGPESPRSQRAISFVSGDERPREDSYAGSVSSVERDRDRQSSIGHSSVSHWSPEAGGPSVKRWSRAGPLPKMLTPPAGPPPAPPSLGQLAVDNLSHTSISDIAHPYAQGGEEADIERPLSRTSTRSNASGVLGHLPKFRRMSASSTRSGNSSGDSPRKSKRFSRQSLPPAPPPPVGVPPPPPPSSTTVSRRFSSPTGKLPTETTLSQRSFRRSLVPPLTGGPPSAQLPPRPDELGVRGLSHGSDHLKPKPSLSSTSTMLLYTIPASPSPGPKPAPPEIQSFLPRDSSKSSFDARPTMLNRTASGRATGQDMVPFPPPSPRPLPSTPIGEPIITFPPSADFLSLQTPVTPVSTSMALRTSAFNLHDSFPSSFTSLSPPPRRGSRQVVVPERPKEKIEPSHGSIDESGKRLSPQDSAVSLGFVGM